MGRNYRNIAILGSTGSIGVNALDVVRKLNKKKERAMLDRVWGLSAQKNTRVLKKQIEEFKPRVVVVSDPKSFSEIESWARKKRLKLTLWKGEEGLERLAGAPEVHFLLSAVVGAVGLLPLLNALKSGKKVALANKESLIVAGDLLKETAQKSGAEIIPVDSEHSAIFQCLAPEEKENLNGSLKKKRSIKKLILTASGGAFYKRQGSLNKVSVEEALNHPTWKMGKKITIDCATLTNKGLEAIEAHHLFNIPMENIDIVIHPQSIVHSLVEFSDGALLGQLSHPDMRLPIQYAMTHPDRFPTSVKALNLAEMGKLEFYQPDFGRFPCLNMVLTAGKRGGTWPAVYNGANEVMVQAFIHKEISFLDIPRLLGKIMNAYLKVVKNNFQKKKLSLSDIIKADQWGREKAHDLVATGHLKKV